MFRSVFLPGFRRLILAVLFLCLWISPAWLGAQAPTPPAPSQDAPAKPNPTPEPPQPTAPANEQEVSSRDTPTTFKVRVNLVLVRVVVRDSDGKVIPNLRKEDFQLSDNRKLQTISSFSVEKLGARNDSLPASRGAAGNPSSADPTAEKVAALPQRFVAMVFDDVHMSMQDVMFVRGSATRFFESLAASDRVSINTTSGQLKQEFTDDHELLNKALLGILPRSGGGSNLQQCPDVSYYQADLIVNKSDPQALAIATDDALQCAFGGDPTMRSAALAMAQSMAQAEVSRGDSDAEYAYRHLEDSIRRLTGMPGQRVLVLVSPGFIQSTLYSEVSDLVDRATRSNIVINTIDARGLYASDAAGDIGSPYRDSSRTAGYHATYRMAAQSAQDDVLAQLADGTGGTFFHNRNDLDEGMREAGAAPALSYLLGFSPQNLKLNGQYHTLKVALTNKEKFKLQARHGYYAPRSVADPAEAAKEEIREALFSQEEIRDLPLDLQTQYFKKDQAEARLAVLTHLDVKGIRFRKALGRNNDQLTIVTGIFDENGNMVTGGEKVIDMKLLDTTYARLSHSGFTVKSSFDVKPGTYLVRLVVRDAEGAQMAARNGAVVIPY
jgi:VWFA-related protein